MAISGQVILATGGDGDWQLPALGVWGPVVWCVVALLGYLTFMFLNPLRGYFGESFDLLSEKGHAKLWAMVGLFSVPGFVWQGGSFRLNANGDIEDVPTFAPVMNEFGISNTRFTVSLAKLGGNPDSATSQWFINRSR